MGNPVSGGVKYTGCEKFAIFDPNCCLSRKRCKIGPWLLWNVTRKSWVSGRILSFECEVYSSLVGFLIEIMCYIYIYIYSGVESPLNKGNQI